MGSNHLLCSLSATFLYSKQYYTEETLNKRDYKDRKCADDENPYSAHIVPVKLYTYNCTLAIPLSHYLPCTGKRGMKNIQLLNQIFFLNLTVCVK